MSKYGYSPYVAYKWYRDAVDRSRHDIECFRTCRNCGSKYIPPESDGNGFCSDDCALDYRSLADPFD